MKAKLGRKNTCNTEEWWGLGLSRVPPALVREDWKLKWTELLLKKREIRDPASVPMFFGFLIFLFGHIKA